MKKIIAILCAALVLAACTETLITDSADRLPAVEETTTDGDIKLNLTITRADAFEGGEPGTKAIKTGWNAGDVIMVFIQNTAGRKYLELKCTRTATGFKWVGTCMNGLTEDEIINASQKKLRAVHLPYGSTYVPSSTFSTFNYLGYYDYFLESGIVDYTYDKTKGLSSTLRMAAPEYNTGGTAGKLIDFRVTGFAPSHTYYMNMKYLRRFGAVYVYPNNNLTIVCNVFGLDQERLIQGRKDGETMHFTGLLDQSAVGVPVTFDFTILDQNNKIAYTRTVGPKTVNSNLSVDLGDISDATKWNVTEYEDLGINNSDGKRIYWSKYNLGASATSANPYGYYFFFGQLQGYPIEGTFGNYTCAHSFSSDRMSDSELLARLDSNGNLKPEYDAARAALGGAWRIPTKDEMRQLSDNTTRSSYMPSGEDQNFGITYTSTKAGYTNRNIFLPAAGAVYVQTPGEQGKLLQYLSCTAEVNNNGYTYYRWYYTSLDNPGEFAINGINYSLATTKGVPIRPVFTLQ